MASLTASELAQKTLDGQATTPESAVSISNVGAPATPAPVGIAEQPLSGNTNADFGYKQTLNNLFRDTSNLDSQATLDAQRTQSGTNNALAEAQRNYTDALEGSKQYFGDSGTLRSGIFLKKQGDISTGYAKDSANQITNAQQHLEDLARETASRKQAIELQRQQAELAQADARKQADLQKALAQAQTDAYNELRQGLLGGGGTQSVTTSLGTSGVAFQVDPSTGGTLMDAAGNPITSSETAAKVLAQREAELAAANKPSPNITAATPWGKWTENGYV